MRYYPVDSMPVMLSDKPHLERTLHYCMWLRDIIDNGHGLYAYRDVYDLVPTDLWMKIA